MTSSGVARVRFFGLLYTWQQERGGPTEMDVDVPLEGRRAEDLARDLGLPLERIEAVFVNHVTHDLDRLVRPGDAVAFVPQGIPGPHRFTLGIYGARRGDGR